MQQLIARLDFSLSAFLHGTRELLYSVAVPGLPPHVRSASALRLWNSQRVIVQDDVLALALIDGDDTVHPLLLPTTGYRVFDDAHGNRARKLDFECAVVLPDQRLVVFGSGASAGRVSLCIVVPGAAPRLLDAAALYAAMGAEIRFSGGALNLEGVIVRGERIIFMHRGNGPGAGNAFAEMSLDAFVRWLEARGPVPPFVSITQLDLGNVAGIALGITDACVLDDGRVALLACAENSTSVLTDGPVLACRFAVLEDASLRMTDVRDAQNDASLLKLEGIEVVARGCFEVVADRDDPGIPALLGTLDVRGL
ncbi:MAG: hypothetical protein ABIT36_11935 [Steroidobacteraceae bacterium]